MFCARNCSNRFRQMVCEVSSMNFQLLAHRLTDISLISAILALYLRDSLSFSEESSTSFYHIFNFFSQFCPIFGAILADSYYGNVKTIFYLFFLYSIGWIGMVTITYPFTGLPMASVHPFRFHDLLTILLTGYIYCRPLVMSSLILISIGNGSIRACITSLGGQQFQLPEQSKQLDRFFSQYYFIYSVGILLSKIIPPAIRAHTQCFGKNDCYLAVFGSLATVFLGAWSEYSTACSIRESTSTLLI